MPPPKIGHFYFAEFRTFLLWVDTRYEKFQKFLQWNDDYLPILQVCNVAERGSLNCGHCSKCLRTMAMLDITGFSGKAKTFSFPPDKVDLLLMGIDTLDLRKQFLVTSCRGATC